MNLERKTSPKQMKLKAIRVSRAAEIDYLDLRAIWFESRNSSSKARELASLISSHSDLSHAIKWFEVEERLRKKSRSKAIAQQLNKKSTTESSPPRQWDPVNAGSHVTIYQGGAMGLGKSR